MIIWQWNQCMDLLRIICIIFKKQSELDRCNIMIPLGMSLRGHRAWMSLWSANLGWEGTFGHTQREAAWDTDLCWFMGNNSWVSWLMMFYLLGIFRTSSLGDSISGDPERTVPRRSRGGRGGVRLYRSLQRVAGSWNIKSIFVNERKPDTSS